MGVIRPVTPVSVSVPILKSIYFLEANVSATVDTISVDSGTIKMGVWGYCVGSSCSNVTLGYTLGISTDGLGALISEKIPTALVHSLTYVLVLHPIAAGFGGIALICGLLAHIREFAITGFTTCFAGFGATIGLIAFIFDIIIFSLAKKRIIAAGGTASLGNGIWMTLAGFLCLMFSGCFFGLGRCLIRKRRPEREASEKNRPAPNANYSNTMRQDALGGGYGQGNMYGGNSSSVSKGSLPAFQEYNGEIIPLNSVHHDDDRYDEDEPQHAYRDDSARTEAASLVSGVGMGYGRRTEHGQPISIAAESSYNDLANAGGRSTYQPQQPPRRMQSASSSTITPFVGMSQQTQQQQMPDSSHYIPSSSPPPAGFRSPTRSPPPIAAVATPYSPTYPPEKGAGAYQGAYNSRQYASQASRQASGSTSYPAAGETEGYYQSPSQSPPPASSNEHYYNAPSVAPSYQTHGPSHDPLGGGGGYVDEYGRGAGVDPFEERQEHVGYQTPHQQDPYTLDNAGGGALHNPYDGPRY
ncbi:hypothetical protein P7C70_g2354, partial [Phenoliferia sp. Uapishka_3]